MFVSMCGMACGGILTAMAAYAAYPTIRLTMSGAEVKANYKEVKEFSRESQFHENNLPPPP